MSELSKNKVKLISYIMRFVGHYCRNRALFKEKIATATDKDVYRWLKSFERFLDDFYKDDEVVASWVAKSPEKEFIYRKAVNGRIKVFDRRDEVDI